MPKCALCLLPYINILGESLLIDGKEYNLCPDCIPLYEDHFEYDPGYEIGTCMAGHYGQLGKACIQYNPESGRNEECGEFV